MKDELFSELIGELGERVHDVHPPERILRRYLQRRLPDEGRFSVEVDRLLSPRRVGRWTLTEVSLHVATCRECSARLAELRAARTAMRAKGWKRRLLVWNARWRLAYYLPIATITAGLIVLLLNLFIFNSSLSHHNFTCGGRSM